MTKEQKGLKLIVAEALEEIVLPQIQELRDDIGNLRDGFGNLHGEFKGLKNEFKDLKNEFTEFKEDNQKEHNIIISSLEKISTVQNAEVNRTDNLEARVVKLEKHRV